MAVAVPAAIVIAISAVQNAQWKAAYNQEKYETAIALVESGEYDIRAAIAAFDALGNYQDSAQRAQELRELIYPQYMECVAAFESGSEKEDVAAAFETVGGIDFFDGRMPVLTQEEILDTTGGPWHAYRDSYSEENGYRGYIERNFCFYPAGRTFDMGYEEGSWRTEGNQIIIRRKNSYAEDGYIDFAYEVRQVSDGVYMLVNVTWSTPSVEYLFRKPIW